MLKWVFTISLLILFLTGCSASTGANGAGEGIGSTLEKAKNEGKIVIGFSGAKPYAYVDENGKLTGQAVEVARAVFKKLGIETVEGQLTKFSSLILALQSGEVDVIIDGMYITPERCEQVLFGEPEYSIGEALVVQKGNPHHLNRYEDIAANPDLKVGILNGAIEKDYLKAAGVRESQIIMVQDKSAIITVLESGRADAITMTSPALQSVLAKVDEENIEHVQDFVQPTVNGASVRGYGAAAFALDDEELRDAYNRALAELKDSGQLFEINRSFGFTEVDMPGEMTTAKLCNQSNLAMRK